MIAFLQEAHVELALVDMLKSVAYADAHEPEIAYDGSEASAAVDSGELGVGRLWRKLGAVEVRFEDDEPFFNVNAPEDLATWRARRRQRR